MAEFSLESCTNDWWPANLKLLELEYENSKFLVQQDGLMSQKWKADIDLLINEEKLYRESQTYEQLSQTSKEQIQLLQNELRSLEKELKESKELLCQASESLKDAREKNKLEKEELEERLTLEAEERLAKEKEEFKKERNALKNEIEKWKNMKEKLGEEMKEMEKTLRTEADKKIKQQEKEAKNEIESLNEQIKNWQDKHMKAVQEVEDLHNTLASKTVVSKVKATQTQAKMASKALMAEIECASTGVQVEIETESENKKEKDVGDTKESNPLPKKQNRRTRKSVLQSHRSSEPEKDSGQTGETSGSESDQQCVKQMKKIPNDSKTGTNLAPSKAKQKRTTNTRKSVQSKKKKTSDEEGGAFKLKGKEEEYPELPEDVGTGEQGDVPTEVQDDGPTEMHQEVPTGVQEDQSTENEAMDNEPADKSTKRVHKRTRHREPCNVETINAKKVKASNKTTAEDESRARKLSDEKHNNNDKTCLGTMEDENNALLSGEKQEKPSSVIKSLSVDDKKQRKTSEQILKEKNGQAPVKSCTASAISQSKYPCPRPSINDKTRQSSMIAEMSSILNGTKRQRTLYNTKDSSLMVSLLPVQESFMNSTTSRGNKPPSLSEFMRSFIAPKLKKKPTS